MEQKIILGVILICVICCCLLCGLITTTIFLTNKIMVYPTNPYVVQLPDSARNIQEESVDLFPDWAYYLKAEIEADDFLSYTQALSLERYTPENEYFGESIWINWSGGPVAPDWWNPSTERDGTYLRQDGDLWVLAKYENGFLYLMEFTH